MNHKERTNLLEKALELHKANSHDDAEKLYARVREACPRDFDAWFLSGAMAFQRGGHLEQAIELLKTARKLNPSSIECRMFLGMALADLGRHSEATPHLETTLKKFPHQTEVWKNLAKCKHSTGNLSGAREALEKLAQLETNNPASHEMLGELVAELSGFQQAESYFRRALELDPNMAMAWSNLGLSLIEQSGHIGQGMECFDKALQLDPFFMEASSARALGLQRLYKTEESLDLYISILWMQPQNARIQSARNMLLNYLSGQDSQTVFEAHKEFGTHFTTDEFQVFFNPPEPEKKLRVGFISPDLRHHSVAFFLKPILANLDPERVQTILYHCHHTEDATSAVLRSLAGKWTSLNGIDDNLAAEIIRKDAPDILIDLAGHSAMNRLPLFAKNLAPVQMTYLGYPNTTGLPAIGYRLVDEITDPTGEADSLATEKLLRFSPCAWAYEPPKDAPAPSMPDASAPITFGSFNNFLKVSADTLSAWARLLERAPGSRLLIKSPYLEDSEVLASVHEKLTAAGIATDRVELLGFFASIAEHLAAYSRVDVGLDTFPYNGTTTTCEALWMGVPVVSLIGDRHASRVGLSLLTAVGHADWATENTEAYIEKAAELANNRELRQSLRNSLREDLAKSVLSDHPGHAARFETALRLAWGEWCQGR
jgi:tetratricopeptide (TPR) repeat protein/glycosyltransferase involved in cell wall biosynthesis